MPDYRNFFIIADIHLFFFFLNEECNLCVEEGITKKMPWFLFALCNPAVGERFP